jgi:hypothetical protein
MNVPLKPIVPKGHPDPKKALDQAGAAIATLRRMQRDAALHTTRYWERYLEDCKIHGVEPVKENP